MTNGDARIHELGEAFLGSAAFKSLFREGIALVEETSAYIEGEGRLESRALSRAGTLAYARESMRLTTRLMQCTAWLLTYRAVSEGEITLAQAKDESRRVPLERTEPAPAPSREPALAAGDDALPTRLVDLVERSHRLKARLLHLDTMLARAAARLQDAS